MKIHIGYYTISDYDGTISFIVASNNRSEVKKIVSKKLEVEENKINVIAINAKYLGKETKPFIIDKLPL